MKKAFAILAGAAALCSSQTVAASQAYIVPDAATPWVFQGVIEIYKGIPLSCNATIEISGTNDASDTSIPFDHSDVAGLSATITLSGGFLGLCYVVTVDPIAAGNISYSAGVFTFHDAFVTTYPAGDCQGDLHFAWDESANPPMLTVEQELPPVLGQPCSLLGLVELISPGAGDVRAPGDPDHDPHRDI